jgi:hypothetical protein
MSEWGIYLTLRQNQLVGKRRANIMTEKEQLIPKNITLSQQGTMFSGSHFM